MRLARDIDTCERLLLGEPVDRARLDPDGLAWATQKRLVRLDLTAMDLIA
jgi:hypothetical protein